MQLLHKSSHVDLSFPHKVLLIERSKDIYQEQTNGPAFHIFVSRSTSCFPDISIASTLRTAKSHEVKDQEENVQTLAKKSLACMHLCKISIEGQVRRRYWKQRFKRLTITRQSRECHINMDWKIFSTFQVYWHLPGSKMSRRTKKINYVMPSYTQFKNIEMDPENTKQSTENKTDLVYGICREIVSQLMHEQSCHNYQSNNRD